MKEIKYIRLSKHIREYFEEIRNEGFNSSVYEQTILNIDLFMASLIIGYKNKIRSNLINPVDSIPYSQFKNKKIVNKLIVEYIAFKFEGEKIVNSSQQCFQVAEQVANAGSEKLRELIETSEEPIIELFRKLYNTMEVNNND